jgi:hypothetical protein
MGKELLSGQYGYARALLSDMTDSQIREIGRYLATGSSVFTEMASLRREAFGPPVKALFEMSRELGPERIWYFIANWHPVMVSDWLSAEMPFEKYVDLFVRGAGMERERAEVLTEKVYTDDGPGRRWADELENKLNSVGFIGDTATGRWLADLATDALAAGARRVMDDNAGRDNLWEAVEAGKVLSREKMRVGTIAASTAYNVLLHRFNLPAGESEVESEGLSAAEMNDPHRVPYLRRLAEVAWGAEKGDPKASLEERMAVQAAARAEFAQVLDEMKRLRRNPLHAYALRNPETGGFFSSIAKAVKKVARPLASIAAAAAPMAGMAFGGPLGSLAAKAGMGIVGKALGGGGSPIARLAINAGSRYVPGLAGTAPGGQLWTGCTPVRR